MIISGESAFIWKFLLVIWYLLITSTYSLPSGSGWQFTVKNICCMWLFSYQKLTSFPQFYTFHAQFANVVNHQSDLSFPITQRRVNVAFDSCETIYAVNQLKNNKTSKDVVCSCKSSCLSASPGCTLTRTLTLMLWHHTRLLQSSRFSISSSNSVVKDRFRRIQKLSQLTSTVNLQNWAKEFHNAMHKHTKCC